MSSSAVIEAPSLFKVFVLTLSATIASAPMACVGAETTRASIPGAPSFDSTRKWLGHQELMGCNSLFGNELGGELLLKNRSFPDPNQFTPLNTQPILGIWALKPPKFSAPPFLRDALVRYEPKKSPGEVYLAYDPILKAVAFKITGNEFDSVGFMIGASAPPAGTPQIDFRVAGRPFPGAAADFPIDIARGLPALESVLHRYGKPRLAHRGCGFSEFAYIGPATPISRGGRKFRSWLILVYSPRMQLRGFILAQA